MHKSRFLIATATLVAASAVHAATATKTNTVTDLADTTAGTWSGGSGTNGAPNGSDLALIDATVTSGTLSVSAPVTWNQLFFTSTGQAIAISGGAIKLNGSADQSGSGFWSLSSNTSNAVTLGNDLDFGTGSTRNTIGANGTGILTLNGNITATGGTGQFLIRGSGTGVINGTITSATQLAKVDGGTWSISSNNTGFLTGGVKIQAGKLLAGNDGSFGSGTITVENGAGSPTTGTIGVVSGTGTRALANNVVIGPASGANTVNTLALDSANGALTLNGNISESASGVGSKLSVAGTNTVTLGGANTFTGGVTLNGTGLTTLTGTNVANTWTISNGNFNAGILVNNAGALAAGSTLNVTTTGSFPVGLQIADNIGTVGAGSTINLSGAGRGTFAIGTGSTLAANITGTAQNLQFVAGNNAVVSGNLSVGTGTISIRNDFTPLAGVTSNNTGTFTISGNISGSGAFSGPNSFTGKLILSGDNSGYSGAITVASSTLATDNNNALGTGNVSVNSSTLQIGNGTANTVTLGTAANLAIANGATLKLGALVAGALDGAGTVVTLQGGTYTFNASGKLDLGGVLNNLTAGTHTYNLISGGTGTDVTLANITGFDTSVSLTSFTNGTLTFAAVPESSTYGLIGAGALAAVAMVRRRRRTAGVV